MSYKENDYINVPKKEYYEVIQSNDDLLEVCESVFNYLEGLPMATEEEESLLDSVEKAINKAKGV